MRRRAVSVKGSESALPADTVAVALDTVANPLLTSACLDLRPNKWGNIEIGADHATSVPVVLAGGDIVHGGATVILAMGDGKSSAKSIDKYLRWKA